VARPAVPASALVVSTTDPAAVWSRMLELVAANPSVAPIVEPLRLEKIEGNVAVVIAPTTTALGAARTRRGAIEEGLSKALGRTIRLELRAAEAAPDSASAPASAVDTAARAQAMNNPLVRRAVELFDARVVDVQDDA
jgi:hypothetical protein